jgi:hypothetical protein
MVQIDVRYKLWVLIVWKEGTGMYIQIRIVFIFHTAER